MILATATLSQPAFPSWQCAPWPCLYMLLCLGLKIQTCSELGRMQYVQGFVG
jgi:hypothetical protein